MKDISDFIEGILETIKPGSRTAGGPKLPKPKDKESPDFQGSDVAPTMPPAMEDEAEDKIGVVPVPVKTVGALEPTVDEDTAKTKTTSSTGLRATPINTKPKKPVPTPNPLGTSISFTAETFQNQVTMTQDPWFIKFYAPWCGHCKAMAPNWVQLGKEMKGRLNVGEVNCDQETRLCKDVHLRGYPTILFFRGGERVEYEGLRGLGDFVTYANKAIDAGDGVRDIDAVEFQELEEKEEVIFVYFYDHATTSEDFAALERLTLSLIGHAKLVQTNSAILAERYKITTWPRLVASRDGRPTYYTALAPQDMRDFRKVLKWMESVWLPIVPELTASNSREIMDGKLVVLGILTRERPDEFMMGKKEIKSAAIEWMDKEIANFQRERQDMRDAKQLRIEEAEDRNDQRALRAAKQIHINMDKADHKEVGFAWVDGVFWERWIRTTYGIEVANDGEKVIINDEDVRPFPLCPFSPSALPTYRNSNAATGTKPSQETPSWPRGPRFSRPSKPSPSPARPRSNPNPPSPTSRSSSSTSAPPSPATATSRSACSLGLCLARRGSCVTGGEGGGGILDWMRRMACWGPVLGRLTD